MTLATFLSGFNQIWTFSTNFHRSPQYKISHNRSSGTRADTCGQTDLTKLIGALRIYWNVPKKVRHLTNTLYVCVSCDYPKRQGLCPTTNGLCNGTGCFLCCRNRRFKFFTYESFYVSVLRIRAVRVVHETAIFNPVWRVSFDQMAG